MPDDHFFVRRVPVAQDAGASSVLEQVELAVEGMAPFPLSQMLLGFWTRPGAAHALVFAAYVKRFGADDVESWAGADLVAPRFTALLGASAPAAATTWVIDEPERGLTLVHFDDDSGVPAAVSFHALAEDAPDALRRETRMAALKAIGESRRIVDVAELTVEAGPSGEGDFTFKTGELTSVLSIEAAESIDVRDRADLTTRRRARVRDRWLWRSLVAAVALIGLCGLTEIGLLGVKTIAKQSPVVTQIMTAQTLAVRIDELSTKRLRPFEMIGVVDSERPESIQFLRTVTNGLYSLIVSAQTNAQPDIDAYRAALAELPATQNVEVRDLASREGRSTFQLVVTFVPGALSVVAENANATAATGASATTSKEPQA